MVLTRKSRETRPFANLGQAVAPPFPNLLGGISDFNGGQLEDYPGMDDAMIKLNTMPPMEVALYAASSSSMRGLKADSAARPSRRELKKSASGHVPQTLH